MPHMPPKGASLAAYQRYIADMCQERGFSQHSVEQKFVKLLEEMGEFAQAATKAAGLPATTDRTHKVAGEAADVFIVFTDLCNRLGVDLEKSVREKEEQNETRIWK